MYDIELQYNCMLPLMSCQVKEYTVQALVDTCLDGSRKKLMMAMKWRDERADDHPSLFVASNTAADKNDLYMYTPENT